jgi:hypothetical protein
MICFFLDIQIIFPQKNKKEKIEKNILFKNKKKKKIKK